jgi:hypothetical protein
MATTIVALTDMLETCTYVIESVESAWTSLSGYKQVLCRANIR